MVGPTDREWTVHWRDRGDAGRHPSTVVYGVNKFGLMSQHPSKHAPRGGLEEDRLRVLVEQGLSVREIALLVGFSSTSVRYWLRRFGLRTQPSRYSRSDDPKPYEILRECRTHGWTAFRRVGRVGGYRCARCSNARVARRRRQVKAMLLAEAGGGCRLCGYDRYPGALQFHHSDPAQKQFQLGHRGVTRSLSVLREEAKKCVLLCANCHAEVEAGVVNLPRSPVQHDPG
jgi:hypothetical protein